MKGKNKSDDDAWKELFDDLQDYWIENIPKFSIPMDEEALGTLSLPLNSLTNLCYFEIPYDRISQYKTYIFPMVEEFGFTPITSIDILSPGDNSLAKDALLLERSNIVVIDTYEPNLWYRRLVHQIDNLRLYIIFILEEIGKLEFSERPNIKILKYPSRYRDFDNLANEIRDTMVDLPEKYKVNQLSEPI